jgi:hypothetical protein
MNYVLYKQVGYLERNLLEFEANLEFKANLESESSHNIDMHQPSHNHVEEDMYSSK